jgi:head-tail adaptor
MVETEETGVVSEEAGSAARFAASADHRHDVKTQTLIAVRHRASIDSAMRWRTDQLRSGLNLRGVKARRSLRQKITNVCEQWAAADAEAARTDWPPLCHCQKTDQFWTSSDILPDL